MMWGQTAQLWKGDPARGFLTWGETHSPHAPGLEGASTFPDRPGPLPPTLFLVPPPLGGASGAESWLWGCGGLSLLPILQASGRNPGETAAEKT